MTKMNETKCALVNPKILLASQNRNEPPSWDFFRPGERIIWVDRTIFAELEVRKFDRPCDICPPELKDICKIKKAENKHGN